MTSFVLRGGQVADGTGRPLRAADVLVEDGRVGAIGDLGGLEQPDSLDRDELFAVRAGLRLLQCNADTPPNIQELAATILIFLDRDNMISKRVHRQA